MPRTILTDDVIERLCPEYQPLSLPNAYFKNVGGMVKSKGIKSTPNRAPPRPARIQYLAQNINMPLMEIQKQVSSNLENAVAQPTITQIVEEPNIMNFPLAVQSFSGVEELEEKEGLEEKQEIIEFLKPEPLSAPVLTGQQKESNLFEKIRDKQKQIDILREKIREAGDKGDFLLINKLEKEFQKATAIKNELQKQSPGGQFIEAMRAEADLAEAEIFASLEKPKTARQISEEKVAQAQANLEEKVEALKPKEETIGALFSRRRSYGLELTAEEEKVYDKSARMKIMGPKMKPVLKEAGTVPKFSRAMEKEREKEERRGMASRDPSLRGSMTRDL